MTVTLPEKNRKSNDERNKLEGETIEDFKAQRTIYKVVKLAWRIQEYKAHL